MAVYLYASIASMPFFQNSSESILDSIEVTSIPLPMYAAIPLYLYDSVPFLLAKHHVSGADPPVRGRPPGRPLGAGGARKKLMLRTYPLKAETASIEL